MSTENWMVIQTRRFRNASEILIIELERLYKLDKIVAIEEYDVHMATYHKRAMDLLLHKNTESLTGNDDLPKFKE